MVARAVATVLVMGLIVAVVAAAGLGLLYVVGWFPA